MQRPRPLDPDRDQSIFDQVLVTVHRVAGRGLAVVERVVGLVDQFVHGKGSVEQGVADTDGYPLGIGEVIGGDFFAESVPAFAGLVRA